MAAHAAGWCPLGRGSVGQAVAWATVDADTEAVAMTMIGGTLIAAEAGQERVFLRTVRLVLGRIRAANLRCWISRRWVRWAAARF